MQIYGGKTYKECPMVSVSCGVPSMLRDQISRKSVSYNKLPQEPIRLTVLKLDGTCFGIYVARNGTVVELKKAVESAFSHLPKNGPGTVSWSHVWGNFCLSYGGEKLLTDSNSIRNYGIKDSDQLEFVRHVSISYPLKTRSEDTNLEEPIESKRTGDGQSECKEENNHQRKLGYQRVDTAKDEEGGITVKTNYEYRSVRLLRKWFSCHIFSRSQTRKGRQSNPWKFANGISMSSGKVWFHSNVKRDSGRETWKAE